MDEQDIDHEIELSMKRLAIPLDESWTPAVRAHLITIRAAIDVVESFPLPDETDQAPVFEA